MRQSDYTLEVIESFKECSKYADIVSIEPMGGKEIFDHAIIRNDIEGILFGIGVLGAIAASRNLVAYECGATGPTKDCDYEDPIIKSMTGVPY